MSKRRDPLGKRALFSAPAQEPKKQHGSLDVVVHCSACDQETTLSAPAFLFQHFPLWAWLPGRKRSHLMRCPKCNHIAWHSVSRAN